MSKMFMNIADEETERGITGDGMSDNYRKSWLEVFLRAVLWNKIKRWEEYEMGQGDE